jgi:hypothetical protein
MGSIFIEVKLVYTMHIKYSLKTHGYRKTMGSKFVSFYIRQALYVKPFTFLLSILIIVLVTCSRLSYVFFTNVTIIYVRCTHTQLISNLKLT